LGIAGIGRASIVIVASFGGIFASSDLVAGIDGTSVTVVTINRLEQAAHAWRAAIGRASIAVVANNICVFATGGRGTGVSGAQVLIIAADGHKLAARRRVATVGCTQAVIVTGDVLADATSGSRTTLGSACVFVVTANSLVLASRRGQAGIIGTFVTVITRNGSVQTSARNLRVARVGGTFVVVVAIRWAIFATGSVSASDARFSCARIPIITNIRANALLSTYAKSQTTSAAICPLNGLAGGGSQAVQDSTQLVPIWSEIRSNNSRDTGGNMLNLVVVGTVGHTNSENSRLNFRGGNRGIVGAILSIVLPVG